MPKPLIASHRGGAFLWPENSLLAFRQALALPAEQIELDVHLSADGEAMVHHDAMLDRTTDARGPLRALAAAALARVRLKGTSGEAVPRLAEVLELLAPTAQGLRLELKADAEGRPYPGLVARCLALLDEAGLRHRTVLMSFQALTVAEAAAAGGFAGLAWLCDARPWRGMGPAAAVALCRACGASELGLPVTELDRDAVAAIRAAGLGLGAWGANHEASIRHGLALGLDALTTDDPPLALKLRG